MMCDPVQPRMCLAFPRPTRSSVTALQWNSTQCKGPPLTFFGLSRNLPISSPRPRCQVPQGLCPTFNPALNTCSVLYPSTAAEEASHLCPRKQRQVLSSTTTVVRFKESQLNNTTTWLFSGILFTSLSGCESWPFGDCSMCWFPVFSGVIVTFVKLN